MLPGCADDTVPSDLAGREAVTFRGCRETVARTADGGEAWTDSDRVGIFLVTTGGTLPDNLVAGADNVEYAVVPDPGNAATATFTPAATDTVYYPTRGKAYAVAYYPWRPAPASDPGTYKINVTDQHDPAAIDVQYAKSGDSDKNAAAIDLAFRHVMSKLVLNARLGAELRPATLTGAPVIGGVPTTATLALADGTLTPGTDATGFAMKRETTTPTFDATFSAILVPQGNGSARSVTFTVNGNPYTWDIPDATPFLAATCYTYTVTIHRTGITVSAAEITPWTTSDPSIDAELAWAGIRTPDDLVAFSNEWNAATDNNARAAVIARWSDDATPDGTVRLLNDIDMKDVNNFTPIGNDYNLPFTGTFDGGGHTISNLSVSITGYYAGLFGYNKGTIRDVTLANADISTDTDDAGGIAGRNNGSISGCTVTGGKITASTDYAGGIAGLNNTTGSITGCTVTGGTITTTSKAGGIAGGNEGSISGCTVTDGTITSSTYYAGGIAGRNNTTGSITGCTVTDGTIKATNEAGGIAGSNDTSGSITGCTVTGETITASNSDAGGIAGWNDGSITECTVTDGTITASTNNAGGIAGSNYTTGSISGCTVTGGTITATDYAGGIAGSNNGSISGCTVTDGKITATNYAGGIAGLNEGSITGCTVTDGTIKATDYAGGIAGWNYTGSITGCIAAPKEVSGTTYTGICAGLNKQTITACYGVTITGMNNVGDGDASGCTSFDKDKVKEPNYFFTAGNPSPIERMNSALQTAGATVRWTAGNADSGWYPVIIEN